MANHDQIDTTALPFNIEKQRAVLGYVIYDERFFSTVISRIEAEWFSEPLVCRIYDALKKWYKKWGKQPTVNELIDCEWITQLNSLEIQQIQATVAMVKKSRELYTPAPLLAEMELWVKARLIQLALPKAANAFNKRELDVSVQCLNAMVRDFHDTRFGEDGAVSFDNYGAELLKTAAEANGALTFGISQMDRLLEPNGNGSGSLRPGDLTVILAPTNVGKTSVMVTTACANIRNGKSVLFVTHEGRPDEIKNKFMRCLTRMTQPELTRAYLNPARAQEMRDWEEVLRRFLVYVPMNKPGLTVEEVAATVARLQDQRQLATGRGFDLLVDDYPAKLTTATASKGQLQMRNIWEVVYNQFVQMALHHKFHVLAAIQTNRDGSKINRKIGNFKGEDRLLHMEDVMEAWGVMTAAATVISVNRTANDAEQNLLTFLLCKSRGGETGWAVVCNTDYNKCLTHANDLGFFWYRGEKGVDKGRDIMGSFQGQVVTSDKIAMIEGHKPT